MAIVFINRFFHPDLSATSQMLSDLAFGLADRGQTVRVITSRSRYEGTGTVLPHCETIGGVRVHRIWTSRFGRRGIAGRAVDYATFYLSATRTLWRLVRPGDTVVVKTDPPLLCIAVSPICWLRRAHLINWLQDLFPEVAQTFGLGGAGMGLVYALLGQLRNAALRMACMNVAIGSRMAERLARLDLPADRITTIPNWADGGVISPVAHEINPFRIGLNSGDAVVVGYSGNLGRVHEIDTILGAMAHFQDGQPADEGQPRTGRNVCWLFIGGGALMNRLKAECGRRNFRNVVFKPYQDKAVLAQSLSAADIHLVSLRPEFEGLVLPSKIYGIGAAGRPIVFIGDPEGEVAREIARHGSGASVATADAVGLAETITLLARDGALRHRMGWAAREAFLADHDRTQAVDRWWALLAASSRDHAGRDEAAQEA